MLRVNSQRLPRHLVQAVIRLQGPRVARQDVRVLGRQTETVRRFGGEQYSSTELDLFSAPVWRLLRHAEKGGDPPVIEPREVTLRV